MGALCFWNAIQQDPLRVAPACWIHQAQLANVQSDSALNWHADSRLFPSVSHWLWSVKLFPACYACWSVSCGSLPVEFVLRMRLNLEFVSTTRRLECFLRCNDFPSRIDFKTAPTRIASSEGKTSWEFGSGHQHQEVGQSPFDQTWHSAAKESYTAYYEKCKVKRSMFCNHVNYHKRHGRMETRPLHFTSSLIHHMSLYHEQIVIDSELH